MLIFDYTPIIAGKWKSRFKTLNLNVCGMQPLNKRDVAPKQRLKIPSVENYMALLLLSMLGQPQDMLL